MITLVGYARETNVMNDPAKTMAVAASCPLVKKGTREFAFWDVCVAAVAAGTGRRSGCESSFTRESDGEGDDVAATAVDVLALDSTRELCVCAASNLASSFASYSSFSYPRIKLSDISTLAGIQAAII